MLRFHHIMIGLVFMFLHGSASTQAIAQSPGWSASFGRYGPNGTVETSIIYQGKLVFVGNFSDIAKATDPNEKLLEDCYGIVAWDGLNWNKLNGGITSTPASSTPGIALTADVFGGYLFIGGKFGGVDGQSANGLARWDGSDWVVVSIPSGFDEVVSLKVGRTSAGNPSLWAVVGYESSYAVYETTDTSPTTTSWTLRAGDVTGRSRLMFPVDDDDDFMYLGGVDSISGMSNTLGLLLWSPADEQWGRTLEDINAPYTCTNRLVNGPLVPAFDAAVFDGLIFFGAGFSSEGLCYETGPQFTGVLETWDPTSVPRWNRGGNLVSLSSGGAQGKSLAVYSECGDPVLFVAGHMPATGETDLFSLVMLDDGVIRVPEGGTSNGIGNSVIVYDGWVYVSGTISNVAGIAVSRVARWGCAVDCLSLDVNGDTFYDVLDILDFIDAFAVCEDQPSPCMHNGVDPNINGDEVVDIVDFLAFFDLQGQCE
ncbi:MAG: hypothetical protein KF912_06010 [Phycisphaeraceae bacterium]|nr:hypothetical protein [Phycisphaeraceae bacterium]MBX3366854.1 hypothetical protein [Phycisphaeraceae bacterium]